MKKYILTTLLCSILFYGFSQNDGKIVKTLKGKVVNQHTNEALSYTNIGLEGTFYGTASNDEGNFELKIPEEFLSKNIYFSAVGFKNRAFPVKDLFDKEFAIIKLESQSYDINDIDIEAQSRVLIRILRMASENIPVNYISGPVNFSGIYTYKKQSEAEESFKQMKLNLYDKTGYSTPSKINAFTSRNYELVPTSKNKKAMLFSEGTTNVDELLELDWVRSASSILNPHLLHDFNLKLKNSLTDNKVWIISFSKNNPGFAVSSDFYATQIEGEIVIGKTDYDIQKISAKVKSEKHNLQGKSLALKDDSRKYLSKVNYQFAVEYKNLSPTIISLDKNYVFNEEKVREESSITINNISVTNVAVIKGRDYFVE